VSYNANCHVCRSDPNAAPSRYRVNTCRPRFFGCQVGDIDLRYGLGNRQLVAARDAVRLRSLTIVQAPWHNAGLHWRDLATACIANPTLSVEVGAIKADNPSAKGVKGSVLKASPPEPWQPPRITLASDVAASKGIRNARQMRCS
jgi:hypothetical protein